MPIQIMLDDVTVMLGNNGVTLKISNTSGHVGDLRIGRSTIEWMKGRTRVGGGVKIPVTKLISLIEENGPGPATGAKTSPARNRLGTRRYPKSPAAEE